MNVEMMGVGVVKMAFAKTDYLVPHINDNDREPSWDGDIEVYRKAGDTHNKSDLIVKIPVQIKGHKANNLRKQSIQYSVALSDLRNYLTAGGTTFLVVYVDESGDKSQIYYANLLPYDLKRLIGKYGHQESKRISLHALPKSKREISNIFLSAATHITRQRPAISCDPVSMDELIKSGQVISLSIGYTRAPEEDDDPIEYLFDHDTYLYAQLPLGLELPVDHVDHIESASATHSCPICVGDTQFYSEFTVEKRKDAFSILLGKGVRFDTQHSNCTNKISFEPTGTLAERITDEDFVIHALEHGGFMLAEHFCPLHVVNPAELENFHIEDRKQRVHALKMVQSLLEKLEAVGELDIASLSDDDQEMLSLLLKSVLGKEYVPWTLGGDFFPDITIANLTFKVCAVQHPTDTTLCRFYSYTDPRIGYHVQYASGRTADVPCHVLLTRKSMLECCNIDFGKVVERIKEFPITEELSGSLVWLLLEMLSAYDESGDQRKDILTAAIDFATWLREVDPFTPQDLLTLNYCQTVARISSLGEEDIAALHTIVESCPTRKDVYVGAYLLLGDVSSAKKHYVEMSDEERDNFNSYPVNKFWRR